MTRYLAPLARWVATLIIVGLAILVARPRIILVAAP